MTWQMRMWSGGSPDRTMGIERGAARAAVLGVPRAYDSLADLLSDPHVDVLDVTSPNDLHLPQTLEILAAGRHVSREKPLAMSANESRRLASSTQIVFENDAGWRSRRSADPGS